MSCIETEPIYDAYSVGRRQYQRFLNILFWDVSVAQLVGSISGVVRVVLSRSWVGISLGTKYLQHLSAQLIHYISLYLSTL